MTDQSSKDEDHYRLEENREALAEKCHLSIGNPELDIDGGSIKLTYLWDKDKSFVDLEGNPHLVLRVELATGEFKEYTLPLRELINQPISIKIGKKRFQIIPRGYEIDSNGSFIDAFHFDIELPPPRARLRDLFRKSRK